MAIASLTPDQLESWIRKASRRLVECDDAMTDLSLRRSSGRMRKLKARARRYRDLLDRLRPKEGDDGELDTLRAEILEAVDFLATARPRWQARLQARAEAGGSVDDYAFPAPPAGASDEEMARYGILRRLGL